MEEKFSRYILDVPYKERVIIYNQINGSLLTVSDSINSLIKNEELSKLKENGSLYEALKKRRFIIPSDFDELDILRFRNRQDMFNKSSYNLIINPTMDCNFKCWYCYENHEKSLMSDDTIESVKKLIKKQIEVERVKYFRLGLFGGEPMIAFNKVVVPISKYLKELCEKQGVKYSIDMVTNGYLLTEDKYGDLKEINLNKFMITLDGIKSIHDNSRILNSGEPTYDKIVSNINSLCIKNNSLVTLRINYNNESLKNIEEIISDFDESIRKNINIHFRRIWQTIKSEEKSSELLESKMKLFKEAGFNINFSSGCYLSGTGIKCGYADRVNSAVINYNGDAFKCTARDFKRDDREGFLSDNGFVKWDMYKIFKRYGHSSFENEECINCRYLPVCMGTCTQHMIERKEGKVNCQLKNMEFNIKSYIISLYESKKG